jgi:hypothetical protein
VLVAHLPFGFHSRTDICDASPAKSRRG